MDMAEISGRLKTLEDLMASTQAAVQRIQVLLETIVRIEERQISQAEALKRAHKRLDDLEQANKECERYRNQQTGASLIGGRFAGPIWGAVAAALTAWAMQGGGL